MQRFNVDVAFVWSWGRRLLSRWLDYRCENALTYNTAIALKADQPPGASIVAG